ncbi:MAG: 50S ribosomal protein L10 [Chloroflexota bacterium]
MAISKARKEELVAQYLELLEKSDAIFLAEYTGMNMKAMNALRDKVYEANGAFHVTKNTLLGYALEQSNMPVPETLLTGQVATGFALGEVPAMAKTLVDFAKSEERLQLRGGIMGSNMLTAQEVEALANLPSLDQLRAQLIGLINAPAQNIVSAVTNGVRQLINVFDAYAKSEDEAAEAAEAAA